LRVVYLSRYFSGLAVFLPWALTPSAAEAKPSGREVRRMVGVRLVGLPHAHF
jgi:hypothetical protein